MNVMLTFLSCILFYELKVILRVLQSRTLEPFIPGDTTKTPKLDTTMSPVTEANPISMETNLQT